MECDSSPFHSLYEQKRKQQVQEVSDQVWQAIHELAGFENSAAEFHQLRVQDMVGGRWRSVKNVAVWMADVFEYCGTFVIGERKIRSSISRVR